MKQLKEIKIQFLRFRCKVKVSTKRTSVLHLENKCEILLRQMSNGSLCLLDRKKEASPVKRLQTTVFYSLNK